MQMLNQKDIEKVSGGILPLIARILVPTIINTIFYITHKHHKDEEVTPEGLAIATGSGLVTGGLGAAGAVAAGGDLLASAVWFPGTAGLNAAGNLIAEKY